MIATLGPYIFDHNTGDCFLYSTDESQNVADKINRHYIKMILPHQSLSELLLLGREITNNCKSCPRAGMSNWRSAGHMWHH